MSKIIWPPRVHHYTFIRQLRDQGFRLAGSGAFASVYVNNKTKRAVKLGQKDDGYIVFAQAVYELQNNRKRKNPYLPRIYNLTMRSQWYMVEMEVLKPIRRTPYLKDARVLCECIERVLVGGSRPRDIAGYVDKFGADVWELTALIGLVCNDAARAPSVDLHDFNIMLRGKQLVVTDPVATSESRVRF